MQGLRASTVERNDLALAISTLGEELENDSSNHRPAVFRVSVEGEPRELHPILRDEIYKIAAEALRNAFHHSQAKQVEVELRYDNEQFRLRVRDDGKGMDAGVLSSHGIEGHYGLRGMRERATLIGGKLAVWSEVDAGNRSGTARSCQRSLRDRSQSVPGCCKNLPERRKHKVMSAGSSQIRILTVDDHPVVRQGIAGLLGCSDRYHFSRRSVQRTRGHSAIPDAPSRHHADGFANAGDEWHRRAHCDSQ